ncbi:FAD synthase-like [Vespa velutina]|uniref:FAD synthase-like n=1 Tax=Vespa velutina TaxID=202808 RepID=UPI001FB56B8B|nr:FAD synthase-like [Vespa velutina]
MFHIRQYTLRNSIKSYQNLLQCWMHDNIEHPSAGLIIIGNEILKARVKDTNSYYACDLLYKCGVKVQKISVISDDVEEIKQEIKRFSKKYTHVITSGGIGPTHDDVTYEGLAKAFDDSLHYHSKLVEIIKDKFDVKNPTSPNYKMAYIPTKASLIFGEGDSLRYPCITLKNIYVFPGSPLFFEKSFGILCKQLFLTNKYFAKDEIYLNAKEELFANTLTILSNKFPNVSFGSYPVSNNSYYKAFITIESDNIEETKKAKQQLCDLIGPDMLVTNNNDPHINSLTKYNNFLNKCQQSFIYEETLETLMKIYHHQSEKIIIYFDGSIESQILIHFAYLANTILGVNEKLQIICLKLSPLFKNDKRLIKDIVKRYNLNIYMLESDVSDDIKKLRSVKPQLEILLVGTEEKKFCETLECQSRNDEVIGELKINNPLCRWTQEDIRIFAKFLLLPFA